MEKKEFKWGIVRNNLKESLYGHRCKSFSSIIVIINESNSMIFTSLVSVSHLKTWKGRQTIRYWPPKTSTTLCVAETTIYLISCLYLPSIYCIHRVSRLVFIYFSFVPNLVWGEHLGEEVWWLITTPFPKPQSKQLLVLYDVVSLLKSMFFP